MTASDLVKGADGVGAVGSELYVALEERIRGAEEWMSAADKLLERCFRCACLVWEGGVEKGVGLTDAPMECPLSCANAPLRWMLLMSRMFHQVGESALAQIDAGPRATTMRTRLQWRWTRGPGWRKWRRSFGRALALRSRCSSSPWRSRSSTQRECGVGRQGCAWDWLLPR